MHAIAAGENISDLQQRGTVPKHTVPAATRNTAPIRNDGAQSRASGVVVDIFPLSVRHSQTTWADYADSKDRNIRRVRKMRSARS